MATKWYYMKSEESCQGQGKHVRFRDIIPQFCKQCSIHGFQHLGKTGGYIKLITWLLLMTSCTAGLIYNAYSISSSYLDFLVYVKIDIQDSKTLTFPAVTVCNTNPVKKSELSNSPRLEALIASWELEGGAKKRRKRATCPNAVEPVSGVCFWVETTGRISQAQAKQACADVGANLAAVDTAAKFTHVFQTLQLASSKSLWLDLTYSDVTGTWQWAESVDLSWSNWENDPGTPPADADKTCTYVPKATNPLTWRNAECDKFGPSSNARPLCMDGTVESVEPTTAAITTQHAETTEVTTSPTTVEQTTEITTDPTTVQQTTEITTDPTTVQQTTEITTDPTTVEQTTEITTDPTTVEQTTEMTTDPTTAAHTTEMTTDPTTVQQTTELTTDPTTVEQTTAVTTDSTTVAHTTQVTTNPTTAAQTTQVTTDPSTVAQSTEVTTDSTTVEHTTEVTTKQPTSEVTTTELSTIVTTLAHTGHVSILSTVPMITTTYKSPTETTVDATTELVTTMDITTSHKTTVFTSTEDKISTVETTNNQAPEITGSVSMVLNADGRELREDFKRESDVMQILSEIPNEEKISLGYKYPEFILECYFSGRHCSQANFDHFFDAVYGNCFVFNSGWNQSESMFTATVSGRQQGLHLLLNVGQVEYISSVGQLAGAVVVVHDQTRMPFPEDEGIMAIPGYVTSVGMKKVSVERLGDRYSECIADTHSVQDTVYTHLYGVNYTLNACEKTCYQNHVINTCDCVDPQYPTTQSASEIPACDARNKTQGDCMNALTLLYIEDQLDCICPMPCSSIMYSYSVSKTMWPSDVELDSLLGLYGDQFSYIQDTSLLEQTIHRNLLRLEVFFESLNFETIQEVPKYPFARYISGLGGIIGLWLGCSVLSIVEILEVLSDTLYLCCVKILRFSNMKPNMDENSSIVSPKIRKKVSPCVLSSLETNPDDDPQPSQSSGSVFLNPTFQGGGRIRNRRRSTLDNIFCVARDNLHVYEVNRLISHGGDEGYSSEEGSPVPGGSKEGTHKVQLHVPRIVRDDQNTTNEETDSKTTNQELQDIKPRAKHEQFLFGKS